MLDDVAWPVDPVPADAATRPPPPPDGGRSPGSPRGAPAPAIHFSFPAAGRRSRWHPVPIGGGGAGMLGPACARPVPVEGTSP